MSDEGKTLGSVLGEAASLDPRIRDRVLTLAEKALEEAEYLMKYGEPGIRSRLTLSFMNTFAKHMRTQEDNNELEALREDMRQLQRAMLGREPGEAPKDKGLDITELEAVEVEVDGPRGDGI